MKATFKTIACAAVAVILAIASCTKNETPEPQAIIKETSNGLPTILVDTSYLKLRTYGGENLTPTKIPPGR